MTTDLLDKEKLCQGRCNYVFQAIKTTTKNPVETEETNNTVEEQIDEAMLFCSVCGHCYNLAFE